MINHTDACSVELYGASEGCLTRTVKHRSEHCLKKVISSELQQDKHEVRGGYPVGTSMSYLLLLLSRNKGLRSV